MSDSTLERVVHAVMPDGCEIVRYDRAGKWYIENPNGSRTLLATVGMAAELAIVAETVYPRQYGGTVFHRTYMKMIGDSK